MKIENVVKKFDKNDIYLCPKCAVEAKIEGISLICVDNHRYDFSKKGYIHLIIIINPQNIMKNCLKHVVLFLIMVFMEMC